MTQRKPRTIAPQDSLRAILKERRKKLLLTQEQMAFLTGYDRTYISLLERGERNPSINAIFAICSVLRVKPSIALRTVEKEAGFEAISDAQLEVGLRKRKRITHFKNL